MKEIFKETNKLLSDNQQVVIATVVRTKGSTPQNQELNC